MKTIDIKIKSKKFMEKGQALTELAIFGSILLFCVAMLVQYGLEANYQQQVQMEAFRKAQKLAFYRSGPNAATSLVLVKDKPLPDPRDQFGYAERTPVAAGESVVWDTNQSAQYVKKFPSSTLTPKEKAELEKDLPAVYFEIDQARKPAQAGAPIPPAAGQNNAFGFYTARFEKRPCPAVITVFFEDRNHNNTRNKNGTEYFPVRVRREDIWVARIEGGFGDTKTEPDYTLLMYPYFRDQEDSSLLKRRITDADVDGDNELEYIIGADKDKNLFYIDYHDALPTSSTTVAGAIQIDTAYSQVEPGDKHKVTGLPLGPEYRQGMIQDFEKATTYTENKIVKTETPATLTSQTTLNAKQTIYHKFRLNSGEIVSIPVEFTVNKNDLYNWSKK